MSESKVNEIVLMDSDSEVESSQSYPAVKKQKVDIQSEDIKKTYISSSSSSRSSLHSNDETSEIENNHSDKLPQFKKPYMSSSSSSSEVSLNEEHNEVESIDDSDESDDSDSDDGLEQISIGDFEEISPRIILETRKYLRENGTMKFLDKYLPTTASSEDIIQLIVQLGFIPRDLPDVSNSNLMELIKFLHLAMKNVRSIRSRLDHFNNINHVVESIRKAKKILVITGAGISTSLGIPDFRSSQGFYSMVQHLGLSDPQEVFDLEIFHSDPNLFYSIAYMILPPDRIYTPLHAFIKLLQNKGKLLRNYTQNIDDLESHVGINTDKLVQCHGSFATATCVTCKYQVKGEKIFAQIRNKSIPYCPKCSKTRNSILQKEEIYIPESYGVMKPDITFFGEPLAERFHKTIRTDLMDCDLLISVGTSLKVAPVADIVEKVPEHIPQILINKDPISHCNFDVSLLGYCDDVAKFLCERLGDDWNIPYPSLEKDTKESLDFEINHLSEEQRLFEISIKNFSDNTTATMSSSSL